MAWRSCLDCRRFFRVGGVDCVRFFWERSFFIASRGLASILYSHFMYVATCLSFPLLPIFSDCVSLPASGGDWRKGATLIDCSHGRQRLCCASLLLHYLLSNTLSADDAATIAAAADSSAVSVSQPLRVGSDSPGDADVDDSTQGRAEAMVTLEDVEAILEDLSVLAAESGEEALVGISLESCVLTAKVCCIEAIVTRAFGCI